MNDFLLSFGPPLAVFAAAGLAVFAGMSAAGERAARQLYRLCGGIGATFLVIIGLLILTEIGSRALAAYVPGLKAYAGYSMAASAFFAFAYTFGHKAHIRMSAIIGRLNGAPRRIAELWCLGTSSFITGFVTWYAVRMVAVSWDLEDISEATDRTLLWIPQIPVALGAAVLFIAVLHRFVDVARGADVGDQRSLDAMASAE